jgi:hypothetical protein
MRVALFHWVPVLKFTFNFLAEDEDDQATPLLKTFPLHHRPTAVCPRQTMGQIVSHTASQTSWQLSLSLGDPWVVCVCVCVASGLFVSRVTVRLLERFRTGTTQTQSSTTSQIQGKCQKYEDQIKLDTRTFNYHECCRVFGSKMK